MEKYREFIGWGSIALAALDFLPLPLPDLPPMLSSGLFMQTPMLGGVLLMLFPMLLFAAGIGLVKGWDGGKKLFAVWSLLAGGAALANIYYNPVYAVVDLMVLGACLVIVFWNDMRRLKWRWRSRS